MTTSTTAFRIEPMSIPATLDGPGGDDFVAMNDVRNRHQAELLGTRDLWYAAREILPGWLNPYEPKRLYVARVEGRIVGRGIYETRADEGSTTCWFGMEVLSDFGGLGIEEALHERLVDLATADGKETINFYVVHSAATSGDRLDSPTGFGSVPADDDSTRFLLAHGYTLGQVERISRLALPVDPASLHGKLDGAVAAAGPDYRLVRWEGRTPEQWLAGIAELNTRMSTDAPSGEMHEDEDVWDEARVRADDELQEADGRAQLVAAVEHAPSGRLVAFNELSVPPETDRPVDQGDTLVLAEHRGHRLGMLVKAANLIALEELYPGHPSVVTFNAEENRFMLSVNEAVGFVAIGYEGGWKRELG